MLRKWSGPGLWLVLTWVVAWGAEPSWGRERQPLPTLHTTRTIEGWQVRVDDRLLQGDHARVGARAVRLLEARLVAIAEVVPEREQTTRKKPEWHQS
jgi:hypothetical protein